MTTNEIKANELETTPAAGKGVDERTRFIAWANQRGMVAFDCEAAFGMEADDRFISPDTSLAWTAWQAALTRQPVAGDGVNGRAWKVGDRVIWTSRFGKPFAGTVTCVRDPIPVRYEVELDDGALCDPLGHELTAAPAATPTDGMVSLDAMATNGCKVSTEIHRVPYRYVSSPVDLKCPKGNGDE